MIIDFAPFDVAQVLQQRGEARYRRRRQLPDMRRDRQRLLLDVAIAGGQRVRDRYRRTRDTAAAE